MNNPFTVQRKEPDEFCAERLPWKATNGVVQSDARTYAEAVQSAASINRERRLQDIPVEGIILSFDKSASEERREGLRMLLEKSSWTLGVERFRVRSFEYAIALHQLEDMGERDKS